MAPRSTQRHLEISKEAGFGRISWLSVLAGLVTAYGAAAIVAAVVGSLLSRAGVETEFRTTDWTGSGAVAALATAVTLLIAYLFGGYVAGRMARRAGVLHGVLVFLASLVVAAIAGGVVALIADGQEERDIRSNLRNIGIPTSTDQLKAVALVGAIVALAAMLLGAIAGGALGERWHTKLARRAADPEYGPAAETRREAAYQDDQRHERVSRDRLVRRDLGDEDEDDDDDDDRFTEGRRQRHPDRETDDEGELIERDRTVVQDRSTERDGDALRDDDDDWDGGQPPVTSTPTDRRYLDQEPMQGSSAIDPDEPRLTEREWREREGG